MELSCSVQNYHWGKSSTESQVAALAAKNDPEKHVLDDSKRYAELWMGTHPSGPSTLKSSGQLLADFLKANTGAVGGQGSNLPYLFKVLSVDTALSIQAHPNKTHAEQLHAARPDVYKDDNHKPEMALALTEFEGLCGFRPLKEIQHNLKVKCPELSSLIHCQDLIEANDTNYQEALKSCFGNLMRQDKDKIKAVLEAVKDRVSSLEDEDRDYAMFLRLMTQYPGDVGCFVLFFLNLVTLQPGEAMYLGSNVPHAYLHGDCIECMARSDNVVRAGLTPKLIDVETLVEMLDYSCVSDVKFSPVTEDEYCTVYDPPIPDFSVAKISAKNAENLNLIQRKTGSILIVVEGSGNYLFQGKEAQFEAGSVLFVPANETLTLSKAVNVVAYQAFF